MKYSSQHIGKIIDGKWLNKEIFESEVKYVVFDSRKVSFPEFSVFFAFISNRNDGHDFIDTLYKTGVRNFVVSKEIKTDSFPKANFLYVENTLNALQNLALYHRKRFSLPLIGITGSNGKTIVKEWLYQLLSEDFNICRSPGSFNSQIGVPLSILQLSAQHQLGIFEVGISQRGEMDRLSPMIDCQIGLFTNIGSAHDDGFKNKQQKIKEKLKLFDNSEILILCRDNETVYEIAKSSYSGKIITWSRLEAATLQILKEEKTARNTWLLKAKYGNQKIALELPFTDKVSIENAIHCWLILLHLNIPQQKIQHRMLKLSAIKMRLELKAGINGSTLINDSYNSDLTSLAMALDFLDQQSGQLKRTVILSDILQSRKTPRVLYREVAELLKQKAVEKFIGIGTEIITLKAFSNIAEQIYFEDTETFLNHYNPKHFQKEIILLKGARNFKFERVANFLARKTHNTRLEIDLNALKHNLNFFKQLLRPDTKMMVMIKAAAYGTGSDEVARLLQFQKVDYLAVAYTDEGVDLREAGIHLPIMVLNPELATFETMLRYKLEPEIYSINLLQKLIRQIPPGKKTSIHLKLDTGMHRLGFEQPDMDDLIKILKTHPELEIASIFTHLAASDEAKHDEFTEQQIRLFESMYTEICTKMGIQPIAHILNSSGIIRFPQYQKDMVRLGIGLYGIDVNQSLRHQLEPVLALKASISQIKTVSKGETIGYSRKGKADKKMRIATISIGYADGLRRKAGNGAFEVLISGKKAPVIGNVCMDMTMVDISNIPEAGEGDEVIIFGKEHPVEQLAECYDSLVYEVFTGISERVKRVHFQD